MKYLVAIMLPPEITARVSSLQQKYKPKRWRIAIGPHITLVHRGNIKLGAEAELIETLRIAALYFHPFTIETERVEMFDRKQKIFYITVKKIPELSNLHEATVKAVEPLLKSDDRYSKIGEYRPHITLANRLDADEAEAIMTPIRNEDVAFTFRSRGFSLFKRAPRDEMWQEVETFYFGDEAEGKT